MRRRTSDVYRDKLFDWALRAHSTKRKANIFTTDDKNDFVLQVFNDRNNSQISSLHNVKLAAKLTAEKGNMNALNLHRNRRRVSL